MRRILAFLPADFWALLLVALPVAALALERMAQLNGAPSLLPGPNDPDPWLRLALVRDWLQGGSWFAHEVLRGNAPEGGIASPWTRPLDTVIAALVGLQADAAPLNMKLMRAAAALPLLWAMLLVLGLCAALRAVKAAPASAPIAAILIVSTPMFWNYFGQGNADHHALLAALWAWVLAASLQPQPRPRDSWLLGLLLALMLWISPETLLLVGAVYLWQGLRWLVTGQGLLALAHTTGAAAYGLVLALVVERAPGTWLLPLYDTLSIVHVTLLALCALAVRVVALLPDRLLARRHWRMLAAKLGTTGVLLAMALLYPDFFHGPMVGVAPYIHSDFLPRISEARGLFMRHPLTVASLLALPLAAAVLYARRWRQPQAGQLLFLLGVTLLMACIQVRWYYYLFPLLALMLAPPLAAAFRTHRASLPVALLALAAGLPMLLGGLAYRPASPETARIQACERVARHALHTGALTRALGDAPHILYAPTNLGAEVLFFTPYRILASNYHREGESIRYVWDAYKVPRMEALRPYLARRKVEALLLCPDRRAPASGALMRLWHGEAPPAWLTPVPVPGWKGVADAPRLLLVAKPGTIR